MRRWQRTFCIGLTNALVLEGIMRLTPSLPVWLQFVLMVLFSIVTEYGYQGEFRPWRELARYLSMRAMRLGGAPAGDVSD